MHDITRHKPQRLGYYRLRLREHSPLHLLYGERVIHARYVEQAIGRRLHRFFDLPRPAVGVEAWELIAEN
jgi:hypothetical protein